MFLALELSEKYPRRKFSYHGNYHEDRFISFDYRIYLSEFSAVGFKTRILLEPVHARTLYQSLESGLTEIIYIVLRIKVLFPNLWICITPRNI